MAVPYCSEGNSDRNPPSQHPISPPRKLRDEWLYEAPGNSNSDFLIDKSAQWGADQELEACIRHLERRAHHPTVLDDLRAARRPKPPSLKEQALNDLSLLMSKQVGMFDGKPFFTIRKALELLPDE
jgi:hypothetical protein